MREQIEETAESGKGDAAKKKKHPKKRRIMAAFWAILVIALFLGVRFLLNDQLEITFYHLYSLKAEGAESTRLVVLSDLHNREFGAGNADLVRQINALCPDLIIIAGDMVNADDDNLDIILTLCEKLVEIAPVYYGPGNHENHLFYEKGSPLEELLIEKGVHVLVNRAEEVTIHKTPFLIGGITTAPEGFEEYGAAFFEEYEKSSAFKLLITHYPGLYYQAQLEVTLF